MSNPVTLCANAAAGWHGAWLPALGLRSEKSWRALDAPPQMYFSAITLEPSTFTEAVAAAPGSVCDSWQTLDLRPFGFRVWRRDRMAPSGRRCSAATTPSELQLVRVTTPTAG